MSRLCTILLCIWLIVHFPLTVFINYVMEMGGAQQPSDTRLTEMYSFVFTTLTQDKYFALITPVLGANTFQIRQQIAFTCSIINHRTHISLSSNDSNNFDLTTPVGLINFPILTQLSGPTAALF